MGRRREERGEEEARAQERRGQEKRGEERFDTQPWNDTVKITCSSFTYSDNPK